MPSILNSDDGVVSGTSGLKTTGGNDGLLNIQSNGSTIVAVTGSGISVTGTVSQTGVSTFAAGTASAPSITFTGDTNTGIFSPAADTIAFTEGGAEAMRIDSSGNVGVGTSSITNFGGYVNLAIGGGSSAGGIIQFQTTAGTDGAHIRSDRSGATLSSLVIETRSGTNAPLIFGTNGTERMRIDSSGNVGVGVTPATWTTYKAIQVSSTGAIAAASGGDLVIGNNYYYNSGNKYLTTAAASYYYQYAGAHSWSCAPSGTAGNAATFTQVLAVEKDKSLALQGATSQSGAGITFPATQSASSDANTLDDYEEGSWTPALYDGASNRNPTYLDGPSGTYQKIGKWVYVRWGFRINSKGTAPGSGEVRIYGLPFTSVNIGSYQEPSVSVGTGNLVTAANAGAARMVVVNSGTYLFGRVSNNVDTTWTYNDLQTGSWIIGEVFYETTA